MVNAFMRQRSEKPRHYLFEWREHRGLTQAVVASRTGLSQGKISKLERGALRYTQGDIEALAFAYGCEPADLLRKPGASNELAIIIGGLSPEAQKRALAIVRALAETESAA